MQRQENENGEHAEIDKEKDASIGENKETDKISVDTYIAGNVTETFLQYEQTISSNGFIFLFSFFSLFSPSPLLSIFPCSLLVLSSFCIFSPLSSLSFSSSLFPLLSILLSGFEIFSSSACKFSELLDSFFSSSDLI
jgi:hypothetical protein